MNTHQDLDIRDDDDHDEPVAPATAPTGVKIVVNGRTVVHRHFLQQAMDAMVRRAVAEEPLASPH
jgi:hypothetical protein